MIKVINRQFYTYKFNSSRLKEFGYNVDITINEAKEQKEIIALADNQILRSIRDIRGHHIDYNLLEKWYNERDFLKNRPQSLENSHKIRKIQENIDNMMFIGDYITIVMDSVKQYEHMYKNGVVVNGKLFKRFSCSASQARVSTVVFCNTEIIEELRHRLDNGRDMSVKHTPSKFNAYFGLYGSSTKLVSEPKFIVVKDYKNTTSFMANFVTETDWTKDDIVETKLIKDMKMNRTDGMGLITPRQSEKWAKELGLDYIPSQWCIRQSYIKGMLCTFDIHKFCEFKNGGNYIVDTIYKDNDGNYIKADLRDYDVIITESQFKLWDSYPNVETYIKNYRKNKLFWGISQHTPKEPKDILKLNYQFIQTLNLSKKDVKKLCEQFIDWLYGISYEKFEYMLLFLLGVNHTESSIKEFLRSSDNYWVKSLIVNPELKNDRFIRTKIRDLIKVRIQNGCMGDIFVDGNFQVLVYDPYAFMQHVCGQEVTGLLKKNEFYSNYWNEKGVSQVDGMRSPLTYRSEHVILNLVKTKETEFWYKYCNQGIILNYHGHEVVNFAGADVDYDILATTSNQTIIKSVYREELPVVYDPPNSEKIHITEDDLYKADIFSFGTKIGSITNKSSNAYALLPNLEEQFGKDSMEYKITESRLKQCCVAQSKQIDKTKIGRAVKDIPDIWVSMQEGVEDTYRHILLNKYPYFFKYRYKDCKKDYNRYVDVNEKTCSHKFGMSLKKMFELDRHTPEQKEFIENFYTYMPVIKSNSSMNMLCEYIESINFNISQKIKADEFVGEELYKNANVSYTQEQYKEIVKAFNLHVKNKRFDKMLMLGEDEGSFKYSSEEIFNYKTDNEILFMKLSDVCSNVYIVVNCLIDYFYKEVPRRNKDILWGVYGKYIFNNVKKNTCSKQDVMFPFPRAGGSIKYMGKEYELERIDIC